MTEAATIANTNAGSSRKRQFQDVFQAVIPFSITLTEASIASAATSSGDVTVAGAALGDFVLVSSETDPVDAVFVGQVTAANTVTVSVLNLTGGAVTAFSGGVKVNGVVLKTGDVFEAPSAY